MRLSLIFPASARVAPAVFAVRARSEPTVISTRFRSWAQLRDLPAKSTTVKVLPVQVASPYRLLCVNFLTSRQKKP